MQRPRLARLRLVTRSRSDLVPATDRLTAALPTVAVELAHGAGLGDPVIDVDEWNVSPELTTLDAMVARSFSDAVTVRGRSASLQQVAIEVLTRCQRWIDRRNDASASPSFDLVLDAHAALYDTTALPVNDLEHAVDTWQWMLRLDAHASLALQLAALFQDIEGDVAFDVLRRTGIDEVVASRVRELVVTHRLRRVDLRESVPCGSHGRGKDVEIDLLDDADGLSFFSLTSSGYADSNGVEQTRKEVAHTLARLGERARLQLRSIRLRPDVERHLAAAG